MKAADFDFHLPEGLIAKKPSDKKRPLRLLVLHRNGEIELEDFPVIFLHILMKATCFT